MIETFASSPQATAGMPVAATLLLAGCAAPTLSKDQLALVSIPWGIAEGLLSQAASRPSVGCLAQPKGGPRQPMGSAAEFSAHLHRIYRGAGSTVTASAPVHTCALGPASSIAACAASSPYDSPVAAMGPRRDRLVTTERIAVDCGLPLKTLTLSRPDGLHVAPPATADYDQVKCALQPIQKSDLKGMSMGFIGNEVPE